MTGLRFHDAKRPLGDQGRQGPPSPGVLAVDLDGTLLKTDSLWELFFKALAQGRLVEPFLALASDRAGFKRRLAALTDLELETLPWNEAVVEMARARHAAGAEVWLATAADERLAGQVVRRFDFFSGHVASDGRRNLKGETKAQELASRFGAGGFDYAGDSAADLPVWRQARRAVVVGGPALVRRVREVNADVEVLPSGRSARTAWAAVLQVARPRQWVKNFLLFVPLIAAHAFSLGSFVLAAAAFGAFSLFSSAGYVVNDLLDLESDRRHPEKRRRPFASGAADLPWGAAMFAGGLLAGLGLSLAVSLQLTALALTYLAATLLYSLKLKSLLLVDVVALTLLYCLRVLAGGAALGLEVSQWLLSFSFFVFATLSLTKRLTEIRRLASEGAAPNKRRAYVDGDAGFVRSLAGSCLCCAALTLAIYVGDVAALAQYRAPGILLLFCPVLFLWLARLLKLADEGRMSYDPVFFILRDKTSWLCLALGLIVYVAATRLG